MDTGMRSSLVWIWWPPEDGEERPSDLAPVSFGWVDRGRPVGEPESPNGAVDFVDDLVRFVTEWFDRKVRHGDCWEYVPQNTEDDFTRVHVQCVDGGPVIQVSIACEWDPTFTGSVTDYENRRQNEEDPRRAYTAIRDALAGQRSASPSSWEILKTVIRSNLRLGLVTHGAKDAELEDVLGGRVAIEIACLERAHGSLRTMHHWHHHLEMRGGMHYVLPATKDQDRDR